MKRRPLVVLGFVASFFLGCSLNYAVDAVADDSLTSKPVWTGEGNDAISGFMYGVSLGSALGTHKTYDLFKYLGPDLRDLAISDWREGRVCTGITGMLTAYRSMKVPLSFSDDETEESVASVFYGLLNANQIDCEQAGASWGLNATPNQPQLPFPK